VAVALSGRAGLVSVPRPLAAAAMTESNCVIIRYAPGHRIEQRFVDPKPLEIQSFWARFRHSALKLRGQLV
jgi:hypothetical protein